MGRKKKTTKRVGKVHLTLRGMGERNEKKNAREEGGEKKNQASQFLYLSTSRIVREGYTGERGKKEREICLSGLFFHLILSFSQETNMKGEER